MFLWCHHYKSRGRGCVEHVQQITVITWEHDIQIGGSAVEVKVRSEDYPVR